MHAKSIEKLQILGSNDPVNSKPVTVIEKNNVCTQDTAKLRRSVVKIIVVETCLKRWLKVVNIACIYLDN